MRSHTRRGLLRTGGTLLASAVLAGCTSTSSNTHETTSTSTHEPLTSTSTHEPLTSTTPTRTTHPTTHETRTVETLTDGAKSKTPTPTARAPTTTPSETTIPSTGVSSHETTTTEPTRTATSERTPSPAPDVPTAALHELVAGNTAFAVSLYHRLIADSPRSNLFVSPYSISVALAMTYAGARGKTATQMADTMEYRVKQDRLPPTFNALAHEIQHRGRGGDDTETDHGTETDRTPFELTTANSLWGQAEYPFRESFVDVIAANYGAGLRSVDFSDSAAARKRINGWVADETNGTIEKLVPKGVLDRLTRLVLVNAIYFKANWESAFTEDRTEDATFTALDGSTTSVPMMRQQHSFPYAERDGTQVIELPYVGGDAGMVVILPAEGAFERFERSLTPKRLTKLVGALDSQEGKIRFPRFSYDSQFRLSKALKALGMPVAFDPQNANFSGMADLGKTGENLFIKNVLHKAHIAVDEQGTEAAAATSVVVGATGAVMNPFEMTVDRPFLFVIRERASGSVLFLGRVVDVGDAQ